VSKILVKFYPNFQCPTGVQSVFKVDSQKFSEEPSYKAFFSHAYEVKLWDSAVWGTGEQTKTLYAPGYVGSEVGVEEFWKNFTGISRES
jgi:hypothetical protein